MVKPTSDLFADSTMTFGEHLEELRKALIKALKWLLIGCAIGLYFGSDIVQFVNRPLEAALARYYQEQAVRGIETEQGPLSAAQKEAIRERELIFESILLEPQAIADALRATFPGQDFAPRLPAFQMVESDLSDPQALAAALLSDRAPSPTLRAKLSQSQLEAVRALANDPEVDPVQLRALLAALNKALNRRDLYDPAAFEGVTLSEPTRDLIAKLPNLAPDEVRDLNWRLLAAAYPSAIAKSHPTLVPVMLWRYIKNDDRLKPKSLGVQEPFMLWIKASFLLGFVLASPFVFYHLWMFVAAGLYPHEKRYVHVFLPFSIGLFISGAVLAFFFVFEPVLKYLFEFNSALGIDPDPRVGEWLSFFLWLPLGFGLAFQLPLVMLFLERIGVMSVDMYLSKWRIAVMAIAVLAAVLTPADPISFFFLAIPLLFLYFGGAMLCKWWPAKKSTSDINEQELVAV